MNCTSNNINKSQYDNIYTDTATAATTIQTHIVLISTHLIHFHLYSSTLHFRKRLTDTSLQFRLIRTYMSLFRSTTSSTPVTAPSLILVMIPWLGVTPYIRIIVPDNGLADRCHAIGIARTWRRL